MQLFKHLARHSKTTYLRPQYVMTSFANKGFSNGAVPEGAATSLGDIGEVFKTNYVVEFDQGLSED